MKNTCWSCRASPPISLPSSHWTRSRSGRCSNERDRTWAMHLARASISRFGTSRRGRADRPLYEMLGAKRDSIVPYASLPFYDSLPEYIEAVNEYAKLGYRIFKFHVWGLIEEDSTTCEVGPADVFRFSLSLHDRSRGSVRLGGRPQPGWGNG